MSLLIEMPTLPVPAPEPASAPDPTTERATRRASERATAKDEARQLFAVLVDGGPEARAARARLVELHLPLVRYFARRYANRGEPLDDLLQAGSVGLVKAVDRFEPARGLEFSTYAAPTILGEIRRHFRDRTWAVHVHRGLQELTSQVTRTVTDLTAQLNRAPSVAEICERVGQPEEKVLEALDCAAAYTADSLEAPIGEDLVLGDTLGSEDGGLDDVEMHESLTPALAKLPERERKILQMRFYGNMTQSQIAAKLGISQMHVSRLLARTLTKLRADLLT